MKISSQLHLFSISHPFDQILRGTVRGENQEAPSRLCQLSSGNTCHHPSHPPSLDIIPRSPLVALWWIQNHSDNDHDRLRRFVAGSITGADLGSKLGYCCAHDFLYTAVRVEFK